MIPYHTVNSFSIKINNFKIILRNNTDFVKFMPDEVEVQVGVSTCGLGAGFCLLSSSCKAVQGFQSDTNGGHCNGISKGSDSKASFVCCQYSSGESASESIPTTTTTPVPPTLITDPTPSTTSPPSEDVSFSKQLFFYFSRKKFHTCVFSLSQMS